jgi:hypothetical protein
MLKSCKGENEESQKETLLKTQSSNFAKRRARPYKNGKASFFCTTHPTRKMVEKSLHFGLREGQVKAQSMERPEWESSELAQNRT